MKVDRDVALISLKHKNAALKSLITWFCSDHHADCPQPLYYHLYLMHFTSFCRHLSCCILFLLSVYHYF